MTEAEQIMKCCQAGTRNYQEANNLHAACYAVIGKLLAQRTWVGLTDEEIWQLVNDCVLGGDLHPDKFAKTIEAKIKEKNTSSRMGNM